MRQIVLFSRTSTVQQNVEQQTNLLVDEAIRIGYPKHSHIIVEYQESATKLDTSTRQGIKKLQQTIESNPNIDCVMCFDMTRIARRADVLYTIRDLLLSHNICWIVLKPSYMELIDRTGKLTPTMSLMFGIFTSFAESEMMIKSERFSMAKNELKQQGKKFAGAIKFGYKKTQDKHVVLHPVNSQIVVDIYNHYLENHSSLYETYMWLTGLYPEIFPVLPYKKAQHKIHNILVDPTYLGNWCYPRLVTDELAIKVKEKLSKSKQQARFTTKHTYLGRGILYCKHCGKMMTPVGGVTKAYNCPTDKLHNMTINVDNIDKIIWEDVVAIANINASISNVNKINETKQAIDQKRNIIKSYENEINSLNEQQSKLLNLYLSNKINDLIFENKNNELIKLISIVTSKKDKVQAEILELQSMLDNSQEIATVKSINYDEIEDTNIKLDIIHKYVDRIWVEKIEPRTYTLEFEYKTCIIPQAGKYRYYSAGGHIKVYRINQDETEDLIVNV